jgi:phosphatidylethanolamine-binding protein (PEBP) family uncharacterized protein
MAPKFFSMSLTDGEGFLIPLGIGGTPESGQDLQMLLVGYDDGKEGAESRTKYLNGSAFQLERTEDQEYIKEAPGIGFMNWDRDTKSTLLMFDPDAPERVGSDVAGEKGPFLHWLVTDIGPGAPAGKNMAARKLKTGTTVVDYTPPAPTRGKHRYIFVEFVQTGEVKVNSTARAKWDIKGFLAANKSVLTAISFNYVYVSAGKEAALGPPNPPGKTGLAWDRPWYKTNQENLEKYGEDAYF